MSIGKHLSSNNNLLKNGERNNLHFIINDMNVFDLRVGHIVNYTWKENKNSSMNFMSILYDAVNRGL